MLAPEGLLDNAGSTFMTNALVDHQLALQDDRPLARKQVGVGEAEIDVERRLVLPAEVAILAERYDQRAATMLVHQRPADRAL